MDYVVHIPPVEPEDLLELVGYFKTRLRFTRHIQSRFGSPTDRKLVLDVSEHFDKLFDRQTRDSGGSVFLNHLVPVTVLALEYWEIRNPNFIAACIGHDGIEDTDETFKSIKNKFNHEVAYLIEGVTKPDRGTLNKHSVEYNKLTINKIEEHGFPCVFLKCNCDRLHNLLTLWGSSSKRGAKMWETHQYYYPLAKRHGLPTAELKMAIAHQKRSKD